MLSPILSLHSTSHPTQNPAFHLAFSPPSCYSSIMGHVSYKMPGHGANSYGEGPFRAEHLRSGDPYELSHGHPIECMTSGKRHASKNSKGASLFEAQIKKGLVGVDAGSKLDPEGKTLRAPDIAVFADETEYPGWANEVPLLAVEYSDRGQNKQELEQKIQDLLQAGTKYIWVVNLQGIPSVEVYEPGKKKKVMGLDDVLIADDVLKNPIPVKALFDPKLAQEMTLNGLLETYGFKDIEAVMLEGLEKGKQEGLEEGRQEGLLEGKQEGLEEGQILGALSNLESLFKKGLLSQDQFEIEVAAIKNQR